MKLTQLLCVVYLSVTTSTPVSQLAADMNTSARIVNGYVVDIEEVPYQASLRRRTLAGWSHMCGAVVINERAILTAAHCADGYESELSSLRVVVGTSSKLSGGTTYDISKVIIHNMYIFSTLENDIAILRTARTITFSRSVQPISFASSDYHLSDGTEALVSGYGVTSYIGTSSSVLLAAKLQIVNQEYCASSYFQMATVTSGMVCAGASDPLRDACQGDSGGPLVVNYTLVGIVSWGEGCADTAYPGVYTRVSNYHSWVAQNIADLSV